MRIEELRKRLSNVSVEISEKTLRRWGKNGVITDHQQNLPGTGRGHYEDWPEKALEEAAAVWALLHYRKGITTNMIKTVKEWASLVGPGGFALYIIPPVMRSRTGVHEIKYTDIKLQLAPPDIIAPDGSNEIEKFPGKKREEKVQLVDELIKKWIATVAKVQYTREQEQLARKAGKSSYNKWPLHQGVIVIVVHRRIYQPSPRSWFWQFESLKIGGRTEPGEADTILLFERADGKETDTRKLLAESVSFGR
jgi:hypothetical protein